MTRVRTRGTTLIEVLIVLVVFAVLATVVAPAGRKWRASREFESASARVLDTLSEAHERTLQSKQAKQYGVHVESNSLTLFEGTAYNAASPSNEVIDLGDDVVVTVDLDDDGADIVFVRLTGEVLVGGTLTLTHTSLENERIITIYESGVISEK